WGNLGRSRGQGRGRGGVGGRGGVSHLGLLLGWVGPPHHGTARVVGGTVRGMEAIGDALAAGVWYAIGFGVLVVVALVAVIVAAIVVIARKPTDRTPAPW